MHAVPPLNKILDPSLDPLKPLKPLHVVSRCIQKVRLSAPSLQRDGRTCFSKACFWVYQSATVKIPGSFHAERFRNRVFELDITVVVSGDFEGTHFSGSILEGRRALKATRQLKVPLGES